MVAAIVAIPVVETMARRIPVKMDRFARGRRIFNRICMVVIPIPAEMCIRDSIMTGVKTAMIEIVASAALAAKIGAGGLGGLIFTGLGLNRLDLLLVGGISVALLSLASGAILDGIEKMLTPYLRTAPRRRNIRERKRGII